MHERGYSRLQNFATLFRLVSNTSRGRRGEREKLEQVQVFGKLRFLTEDFFRFLKRKGLRVNPRGVG